MLARDKLGICQWFHYNDFHELDTTLCALSDLKVRHFRTGISWADFYCEGGKDWYDRQMHSLRDAELDVLLSVWHTPPSISEGNACNSPPLCLKDYADFIDLIINEYGDCFSTLELWNEPNNRLKWNFLHYDPQWEKFGEMVLKAGFWARKLGMQTVLGGMIPVDPEWLRLMKSYGVLDNVDSIGIHGFPEMWWPDAPNWDWYSHWSGWESKVEQMKSIAPNHPVWITETGLATVDLKTRERKYHDVQIQMLLDAAAAPAERVYWYSTVDLNPQLDAIEGFHVDENEYHLGLVEFNGRLKPAYHAFRHLMESTEDINCVDYNSLLEQVREWS